MAPPGYWSAQHLSSALTDCSRWGYGASRVARVSDLSQEAGNLEYFFFFLMSNRLNFKSGNQSQKANPTRYNTAVYMEHAHR